MSGSDKFVVDGDTLHFEVYQKNGPERAALCNRGLTQMVDMPMSDWVALARMILEREGAEREREPHIPERFDIGAKTDYGYVVAWTKRHRGEWRLGLADELQGEVKRTALVRGDVLSDVYEVVP